METLVLDCSVAAKWFFPEPGRDAAVKFFDRFAAGDLLLIAPDLLLKEFASLLSKQVRRKIIPAERAVQFFDVMKAALPKRARKASSASSTGVARQAFLKVVG